MTSSNTLGGSRTKTTDQFLLRSTAAFHYFGIEDGLVSRNDLFLSRNDLFFVFSNLAEKGRMWVCLNRSKTLWFPSKGASFSLPVICVLDGWS